MALSQARLCLVFGRGSVLVARHTKAVAPVTFEGHRNLTNSPNYTKPFQYERKGFPYWRTFIDWTTSRLNENSRIIQVEGPPCVGKSELAKKIADEFQLLYVPGVQNDDLYIENGFDKRELNGARSLGNLFYDLEAFYADPDPATRIKIANFQIAIHRAKFDQYRSALKHLLSTGQGVVLENSVWSDFVYADAMYRHKHITRQAYKYYKYVRHMTGYEFWTPHLVIHLDAPTEHILEGLLKKNPAYKDSPVLTKAYIDTLRRNFKENYLPSMSASSEVLSYDINALPDFDIFTMDLAKLELMEEDIDQPQKFKHWRREKEEDYSMYRHRIFDNRYFNNVMTYDMPWEAPELCMEPQQIFDLHYLERSIPQLKYSPEWNKENEGKFTAVV